MPIGLRVRFRDDVEFWAPDPETRKFLREFSKENADADGYFEVYALQKEAEKRLGRVICMRNVCPTKSDSLVAGDAQEHLVYSRSRQ